MKNANDSKKLSKNMGGDEMAHKRHQTRHLSRTVKNKLNAHKVEYDGFMFGSKKEAIRWA